MNTDIFKQWFFDEFVPKVEKHLEEKKLPRQALLLIDNAPSHPEIEYLKSGNIKAMFLPVNVTSLIQSMDQGVINDLKLNFETGCEEVTDNCVKEWLYGDEEEEITDDAIIRMITKEEIDETEDLNDETEKIILHAEGMTAFDVALHYIKQ
ncbi:hypothetical protein AVEN_230730-1 [Araneus ventricosus]|uniref:DDE-1 domain-containing protein n=1 Tax=Araneus ventricosus TaxID=182803 RepID=A0A4Y2A1P9_ARAVE|nr:hypothetical protein AVEN_230730-1 [Araneus ventricosus]